MVQDQQGAKAFGESQGYDLGQNPTNSLLALFPGCIIIVPPLVTYWRGTKRVQGAAGAGRPRAGQRLDRAGALPVHRAGDVPAYLQVSLNHVWEQELNPAPGEKAPPRTDDGADAAETGRRLSRRVEFPC